MNYNKIEFDCIINLDEDKITFNKKLNSNILHLGKKETSIMKILYKDCKSLFKDSNGDYMDDNWMLDKEEHKKDTNKKFKKKVSKKLERKSIYLQNPNESLSMFEGSDDYFRKIFTKYITHFLSDIQLAQQITNSTDFNNEEKLSKIKDVLDEYNCNFIYNWITTTKNFLFWNYEHDKNLWKLSPHLKRSKNVVKRYENGDIYEGELSFGKPNNNGKFEFRIKTIPYIYVGEFSNGLKEGKGNLFSKDNKFNYDGDFKNDKYEGFGALFDHGEKYTGEFKNGKFHGQGTLYEVNGDIVEGEFFEGKLKKGKIIYKNGDTFKGKLLNGEKHFGIYEYKEGGKYEGYFENEIFNGEGILIDKNGNESKGIFKDGEFVEKLDKLKVELDNEIFSEGIKIEIKQNDDDWEIADIKKLPVKEKNKNKDENINKIQENKEENNNKINENKEEDNNKIQENNEGDDEKIYENKINLNEEEDKQNEILNINKINEYKEDNVIIHNDVNYNHNYDNNKFNQTIESIDVVGYTNTTFENISREEIDNDNDN